MLRELSLLLVTLTAVHASGDLVILHSPDSVNFHGQEEIEQSLLKDVLTSILGFTVKPRGTWDGVTITDPFSLPKALVAIVIEGVESLELTKSHFKRFPLRGDEVEEITWQAISACREERANENTAVRINLADGVVALGQSALGELKPAPIDKISLKALSLENEEDRKFLEEIQLLQAIANEVPSTIIPDSNPDVYWLVVSGLKPVLDLHGKNSSAGREAFSLLHSALDAINEAFLNAYDGMVVTVAFTNDASQVRHTRSVLDRQSRAAGNSEDGKSRTIGLTAEAKRLSNYTEYNDNKILMKQDAGQEQSKNVGEQEDIDSNTDSTSEITGDFATPENSDISDDTGTSENPEQDNNIDTNIPKLGQDKLNLAKKYTDNYPVIFNIFLWFGVVFVFSLLAICIAIAEMDPGRDSIIYRMTSNRMKKDN